MVASLSAIIVRRQPPVRRRWLRHCHSLAASLVEVLSVRVRFARKREMREERTGYSLPGAWSLLTNNSFDEW